VDGEGAKDREEEERWQFFTKKTLPDLRKSAVGSSNTLIFVPSYFDFVRLKAHLEATEDLTFASLSEDSSNQDISRARQAFFLGKLNFLLVTERFHFYRRYHIRGAKTVVFYAPPFHPQYYAEYLSYPFEGTNLDESEVSCHVVFSKYDVMRVEGIVGRVDSVKMTQKDEVGKRFVFV